jgi:hypothetical protein
MAAIERIYEMVLASYPADYQARFGEEIRATLARLDARGDRACLEVAGLLRCLVVEWAVKLTDDVAIRGRHLPDCRKIRPAGVTRADWARYL